jgi:hypothetical protein
MKRVIPVLVFLIFLSSCKKSVSDFIWEKSSGKGKAYFIASSPDSGFVTCGEKGGQPYFARFDKARTLTIDLKSDIQGLFNSVWFDTSGYILAGSGSGKLLITRFSTKGTRLWEMSLDAGFKVDFASLSYSGNGSLLAVGTASADSTSSGATGLLFVRFDTTGVISTQKKITETTFMSAEKFSVDNSGNIFLPITRKSSSSKSRASVAKFNDQFAKLWETELYNNPEFGAASRSVKLDPSGNVYIGGNTEVSTKDGKLNNSFMASLSSSGSIRWKKYLENSNFGSTLLLNNAGEIMMLNKNCFIINILSTVDGEEAGRIKMFSQCNSSDTDAVGSGFDLSFDNNILVAGALGGNFYFALKSSKQ